MAVIVKTEEQIVGIRKACHLAADALTHGSVLLKPGVTTESIDDAIRTYIEERGGRPAPLGYRGYPKSTCISINEVICHGIPSDRAVRNGDIVKIDVSVELNGFFGDLCKTFPVGDVSEAATRLMSVTQDCLAIGISQVRPGAEYGAIGRAISAYAASRKHSVVYQFCGHGVGLSLHEEPMISHHLVPDDAYDRTKMEPGHIFAIEPMICQFDPDMRLLADGWTAVTLDGGLAAQFEHSVLVTEDGSEILTS